MNASSLPLARFTVLDLTRVRSGPTAVRQFADWGANVIKIEEPGDAEDDAFSQRAAWKSSMKICASISEVWTHWPFFVRSRL